MQQYHPERILKEKERVGRISQIKELVFGSQDGLLVPLGVVTSVAGAFSNNHIVIVAGVAEALAGSFSMATGAYLASQAERQVHLNEVAKGKVAALPYFKSGIQALLVGAGSGIGGYFIGIILPHSLGIR